MSKDIIKRWKQLALLKGLKPTKESMTDNEIIEYFYKHIKPEEEARYDEVRDSWFYKDEDLWFEHTGSDVHLSMKYDVIEHKKHNTNKEL